MDYQVFRRATRVAWAFIRATPDRRADALTAFGQVVLNEPHLTKTEVIQVIRSRLDMLESLD